MVSALLPVAGAQLVRLQRVEHAHHFLDITADAEIGDHDEADDALRIDDEGRALRNAFVRIQNAKRRGTVRA